MEIEKLNLNAVLDQVGREKNIDKTVLVEALETAMLTAARKKRGMNADIEAHYNEDLQEVEVFEFRTVVKDVTNASCEIAFEDAIKLEPDLTEEDIGEDIGVRLPSAEFGRIAAMTAKQVIIQRVREAERSTVFEEYEDRKGELVTGIARRFERGSIIVDLGRAEAIMPAREQIPRENIRTGEPVVAYVVDVLEISRGPQIILSRAHPNLVVKLFEQEVPEIDDGVVIIEAAAREAGVRTKIAVRSSDSDVDPVGACVGMKGARVQAVVQELRGEKIDIVPWDEDEARFVCNALSPAEVTRVLVDEGNHTMQIVVPDDQLSLAIGRRGQNVRLAAQLSGWKIDITSETKVGEEREVAWASLSRIEGLSDILVQTLYNHGFRSAGDVVHTDNDFLSSLPGFGADVVERIKGSARTVVKEEGNEKVKDREVARVHAKELLAVDLLAISAAEAGKTGVERFTEIGVLPYLIERLTEHLYEAPEDVYFDDDIERLVELVGLSPAKARHLRVQISDAMYEQTDGKAPKNEDELSEPELRDAAQFDADQAADATDADATDADVSDAGADEAPSDVNEAEGVEA
ncbi:MAG: transcription termination/antitermination protein NusA [Deltaproteobacteria bacterium]|nr:transcription termination/antitermination protein NusA [Deltaproteobacteria bacterium]